MKGAPLYLQEIRHSKFWDKKPFDGKHNTPKKIQNSKFCIAVMIFIKRYLFQNKSREQFSI